MAHQEICAIFSGLGNLPIPDDLIDHLNEFICLLYGDNCSQIVDECRYNLFKAGKCSDDALPPNCDCLMHHIARSNFQAASWNRCLSPMLQLPSAVATSYPGSFHDAPDFPGRKDPGIVWSRVPTKISCPWGGGG